MKSEQRDRGDGPSAVSLVAVLWTLRPSGGATGGASGQSDFFIKAQGSQHAARMRLRVARQSAQRPVSLLGIPGIQPRLDRAAAKRHHVT